MLDIWVDIITLKILNMARDGYGLDTRLHNDYIAEIEKKTKDNILCFLAEHDAEIRRQTIEEVVSKLKEHQKAIKKDYEEHIIEEDCFAYRDDECQWCIEIAEQMKGEQK